MSTAARSCICPSAGRRAPRTPGPEVSRSLGGSTFFFHADLLGDGHCDTALVDQVGAKVYLPLSYSEACSPIPRPDLGEARVGAVLLAPLPAGVEVVDVSVHGTVLPQVPVGEGELIPAASDDDRDRGPLLGMGWPTVDTSQIPASTDEYVIPLRQAVADLQGEITETATTIEISGDVLFAKNEYSIDAAGRQVIARAVDQLKDKGRGQHHAGRGRAHRQRW